MRRFARFSGRVTLDAVLGSARTQHFEGRPAHDIDLLLWLGGDRRKLEEPARRTLDIIRAQFPEYYVTVLIDGPEWQDMAPRLACGRAIRLSRATGLPQALYSLALAGCKLPWAAFAWPGSEPDAGALNELRQSASDADLIYVEGARPIPAGAFHPMQYGWLQTVDAIPMERCLLAPHSARQMPFDATPVLQRFFWWNFTIRLSRHGKIVSCGAAFPQPLISWQDYPFGNPAPIEADLAARYINAGDLRKLIHDLPGAAADDLLASCAQWARQTRLQPPDAPAPTQRGAAAPMRVLVLGGVYEPHHNELCFFRIFEKLRGQGYLTWRTLLYDQCRAEDLRQNNLVIFTRPRYPECAALMDICKAGGIGTIVMIDDNWPAAGREYERYRPLFGAGQPALETFLHCVRQADATLVYNRVLAEDMAPYAAKVVEIPPYIDPAAFACQGRPARPGLLAGYSGSPRPETPAFQALAQFAARHADVELLFLGSQLPPELVSIERSRIHAAPFQVSYEGYARKIARWQPDILLAPLDDTRMAASKAPNKFLEIAMVGAAGIYSRVPPYTWYVRDGEAGLLVGNDEPGWSEALERLYGDRALLRSLAAAARREVRDRYTLAQAEPGLLRLLAEAAR